MVKDEEVKQLVAMINWAMSSDDILMVDLKCFKQYNSKDKKWRNKATLTFLKSKEKNHSIIVGDGYSVMEAMKKVSDNL